MSRGPGTLQRAILEVLGSQPGHRMWWSWIKRRFPDEVRNKNFYRAVRGLRRMRRVEFYNDGRFLYLVRKPFYRRGEKIVAADEQLKEILALEEILAFLQSPRERAKAATEAARGWEEFEERWGEGTAGVVAYPPLTEKPIVSDHR